MSPGPVGTKARTIPPSSARIRDVVVLARVIHQDPRGLLIETLREDDRPVRGEHFAMSYTSVTVPGEMRDCDRWHVHQHQQDRFVVALGEMILALYDARADSETRGTLDLLRMAGASVGQPNCTSKLDSTTYIVTVPEGVYHCIGNLHSTEPFFLQNFPTQLYDPEDEGRVPFDSVPIASIGGRGFAWELVEVVR